MKLVVYIPPNSFEGIDITESSALDAVGKCLDAVKVLDK